MSYITILAFKILLSCKRRVRHPVFGTTGKNANNRKEDLWPCSLPWILLIVSWSSCLGRKIGNIRGKRQPRHRMLLSSQFVILAYFFKYTTLELEIWKISSHRTNMQPLTCGRCLTEASVRVLRIRPRSPNADSQEALNGFPETGPSASPSPLPALLCKSANLRAAGG